MVSIYDYLASNPYPGRGVAIGKTADGKHAVILYFIMGRSVNSRNRIFVPLEEPLGEGIRTEAFDPSKLSDPSLIIYAPVRMATNGRTVVTNGDQTDTIVETLASGGTFADALRTRVFEPDAPNFTPRISGILEVADGKASYKLSILKKSPYCDGCDRQFFEYAEPANGRTVVTNGDQTDTIVETLAAGGTFADALRTRVFEPDAPNFTPRISGILEVAEGKPSYKLSILKKSPYGDGCDRQFFEYAEPANGVGHIIHTYACDGDPIPSFGGEPVAFGVGSDLKAIADGVWNALHPENKVSLFARFVSLEDGKTETLLYNKNQK